MKYPSKQTWVTLLTLNSYKFSIEATDWNSSRLGSLSLLNCVAGTVTALAIGLTATLATCLNILYSVL